MKVYLDDFFNANDRNLDFFCKIDISQKQSVLVEHTLRFGVLNTVSRINSRSWVDQFSNMMEY